MTIFILELTTGGKFEISESEAKTVALAPEDRSITIPRLGIVVPKRMAIVYPKAIEPEKRGEQKIGVLHDGSKVRRHFGEWVDMNSVPDDKGNYTPVRLDPEYYPEVAMDRVATPEEYARIQETKADYYEFLQIKKDFRPRLAGSPEPISKLLEQKKED